MLAMGYNLRTIARSLGRATSTLSREISRNGDSRESYRATTAQRWAYRRTRTRHKQRKLTQYSKLRHRVFELLAQRWSPEQIAKFLSNHYPNTSEMSISHEAIYTYLYVLPRGTLKKQLIAYLHKHHHVRRPRHRNLIKPRAIQDIVSIEERPEEVAHRTIAGHWEGDLLMGKRNTSALGVLVERVTRFTILVPLKAKDALSVREAFVREMINLPEQVRRSLTYDQGVEMREHRLFTEQTKMKVYFAHPHSPWERGTNENTNGLLRQYFPKGTEFSKISVTEIKRIQDEFNGRPRKVLNWQMPSDVFNALLHL